MSQEQKYEEGTRVLSEEELRNFEGTTIDEEGRPYDAPHHESSNQEQTYYTMPNVKTILWNAISWKWKVGLALGLIAILTILFLLAKYLFTGLVILFLAWFIVRMIGNIL